MKKIITVLLLATALTLNAQVQDLPYKVENSSIVVSKVVEDIPGDKQAIYSAARNYFVRAYGDGNSVIQTDDKDAGLIVGKGLYDALHSFGIFWNVKAWHILRVDAKDGRARIVCSSDRMCAYHPQNRGIEYPITAYFPFQKKVAPYMTKGATEKALDVLVERMNESVESLTKALMQGGIIESEKGDW